ncbi:MAG TPA: HAD family phosphatase [Candidatus Saccharimonadales bacterium]|nr:HAD family phosphatase [Candidatus Saccharimonadales bacterium]
MVPSHQAGEFAPRQHGPAELGVIFDMDGVLFDALAQLTPALDRALEAHGIRMDQFDTRYDFRGRPLNAITVAAREQFGVAIEDETFSQAVGMGAIGLMVEQKVVADTGLVTLLDDLRNEGVPTAVGSSSPRWRIQKILAVLGIDSYFDAYVGTEDVPEHKPNPHVFLEAAQRIGIAADHCVVIEDAVAGVTAAKRANMKAVGFLKYNDDKASLAAADLLVEDYSELSVVRLRQLLTAS